MNLGSFGLKGRFTKDRLEVSQADWKVYDGLLSAAGSVALAARVPDLEFEAG